MSLNSSIFCLIILLLISFSANAQNDLKDEYDLTAKQKVVTVVLNPSVLEAKAKSPQEKPRDPQGKRQNIFDFNNSNYHEMLFRRVNKFLANGYYVAKVEKVLIPFEEVVKLEEVVQIEEYTQVRDLITSRKESSQKESLKQNHLLVLTFILNKYEKEDDSE